jgi:hypothetical protein
MTVFDPIKWRRDKLATLSYEAKISYERQKTLGKLGTSAYFSLPTILECWLVGLEPEARWLVARSRAWLEESIALPEELSYVRKIDLGQVIWLMDNISRSDLFSQSCAERIRLLPETEASQIKFGLGGTLKYFIQAGDYEGGIEYSRLAGGGKAVSASKVKTERQLGQWILEGKAKGTLSDDEIVSVGTRVLTILMQDHWLTRGHARSAAGWLKVVYWHTGATKTPLQTVLKAYDCMPQVVRPAFVDDVLRGE